MLKDTYTTLLQTAERLFALADVDGNGVIDLNEFLLLRHRVEEIRTTAPPVFREKVVQHQETESK